MFHVDITLEDSRMIADYNGYNSSKWFAQITDLHTGIQSLMIQLTCDEMQAVLNLAMYRDGTPQAMDTDACYKLAEPIMAQLPPECRIIP